MKNERTLTLVALLCSAGAPLACSGGGAVNIGNTSVVGSQLSDYAATWDGYAEAYTFMPDGSDRVRLTITADGQGTLQVGKAALLPPPTDPNVGYPPGEPLLPAGPSSGLSGGVLYPVYAAMVQENRIQAGLRPNDYYGPWCALQTPYYFLAGYVGPDKVTEYEYACLPQTGGGYSGAGADAQCFIPIDSPDASASSQMVDCGKWALCITGNVCTCTATSCTASPVVSAGAVPSDYPAELDAALDSTGETLTGTLNIDGTRVTVVLTKQ